MLECCGRWRLGEGRNNWIETFQEPHLSIDKGSPGLCVDLSHGNKVAR
jgi:hypothetical protein